MDALIEKSAEDLPWLRGATVVALPDGLLYASWVRSAPGWTDEDIAAQVSELLRASRASLRAVGAWSSDLQCSVESQDALVLVRELSPEFALGALFDRTTPVGVARLALRRLTDRLVPSLPRATELDRPRGLRALEYLDRCAPDPSAALLRVAQRTGLTLEDLRHAERLDAERSAAVEEAACRVLGVRQLAG